VKSAKCPVYIVDQVDPKGGLTAFPQMPRTLISPPGRISSSLRESSSPAGLCKQESLVPVLSYPHLQAQQSHHEAQTEFRGCSRGRCGRRRRGAGCDSFKGDLRQLEPGCPPSPSHYERKVHRAHSSSSRGCPSCAERKGYSRYVQRLSAKTSPRTNNSQLDPRPALAKPSPTSSPSSTPSCDGKRPRQGRPRPSPH
jgi:hypothetical protein